jgi:DNA repair protein RadA/Sms
VIGEVGLTGEVRAVGQLENRVSEIRKMGFTRCIVPESSLKRMPVQEGIEVIGVKSVEKAVENLF